MQDVSNNPNPIFEFFSYLRSVRKDQGEFINDGVTNSLKEVQKLHDQAVNKINQVLADK